MPVKTIRSKTGAWFVVDDPTPIQNNGKTCIYGRVSSYAKKDDLERQISRCEDFCLANGWVVDKVYKEIASGMNDKRKLLVKMVSDKPSRIIVENKDRLTRFGFNYFEIMLPMLGTELIVINRDREDEKDLMKDLVAVITSFCCRLYGMRRGYSKVKMVKEEILSA